MRFPSLLLFMPAVASAGAGVFTDMRGEYSLAVAPGVDVEKDGILDTGGSASAQAKMNDGSLLWRGADRCPHPDDAPALRP